MEGIVELDDEWMLGSFENVELANGVDYLLF